MNSAYPTTMRFSLSHLFILGLVACSGSGGVTTQVASVNDTFPTGFYSITLRSTSVPDAGASSGMTSFEVQAGGQLNYHNGLAPAEATMTDSERRAFAAFLNKPGVLDELRSLAPCGPAITGASEYLAVGYEGSTYTAKVISGCQQPVYEQLRSMLKELQANHFHWAEGVCPAPNVWRYLSAGCGKDAPRPVCGSSIGDGCLRYHCSCNGQDIGGCDFVSEPYAYGGFCIGDAGGRG
jgi:hypothetical protein